MVTAVPGFFCSAVLRLNKLLFFPHFFAWRTYSLKPSAINNDIETLFITVLLEKKKCFIPIDSSCKVSRENRHLGDYTSRHSETMKEEKKKP